MTRAKSTGPIDPSVAGFSIQVLLSFWLPPKLGSPLASLRSAVRCSPIGSLVGWGGVGDELTTFYIGCECDSLLNNAVDECNAHIVACGDAFSRYLPMCFNWLTPC